MKASLGFERPLTTVDVAIFSVVDDGLKVLLVKRPDDKSEPFPGLWALPGGFVDVDKDETLEQCASRKLREKTQVASAYLEQVGSWGDSKRDPRGWSATHVYFSLLAAEQIELAPGGNAAEARWVAVDGTRVREKLAFDHAELLKAALERLRSKVEYTSLPAFLLGPEFTLSDLQHVYEILLDRPLEKKAFRTRMQAVELLEPLPRYTAGANRPAQYFRLRQRRKAVFFARPFSPRE
jgi:8-oxo-dGTP diphosphatase